MIDRLRRDQFAQHLRHYVAGLITNWEFEDRLWDDILPPGRVKNWPEPFLWMMFGMVWTLYSDTRCYKLRGRDRLPHAGRHIVARWITFLYSDRSYERPLVDIISPAGCLLSLATLGVAGRARCMREIDMDLWPYHTHADLEEDLRRPRLLAGARQRAGPPAA